MIQCTFEDGGTGNLRHVVVDGIVLKDHKILLVRREMNLSEGGKWGFPGGYVDLDETVEQAVEREVLEETGYKVGKVKLLTVVDSPIRRNDDKQNIVFVYYCNALEKVGEPDKESSEQKWFDLNKLPNLEETAFDHLQIIHSFLINKDVSVEFVKA